MMPKKKSSARTPAPKKLKADAPNVYWRSVSMDQLREQDRCIALAPLAEEQELQGIKSHRYVRQDSRLWSVLHDGMLTTGRLKAALGMHESAAAAIIGIHPGSRGSSHLISAYSHLVNTTYSTRSMSTATNNNNITTINSSQKPGSRQQQDLKAAKAPVGNQQLQKPFGGLLPRPVMLQQPVSQYHTQPQQQQQQQEQQRESAAAAESIRQLEAARQSYNQQIKQQASAAAAPPAPSGAGLSSWSVNEVASSAAIDAARQHSERAAAGGDISVKLCWGNTQEAAALYCIMNMFPNSLLEEVGLFELDATELPAAWEIQPHLLPPLGASPDAVLVHNITLLPEDLQAAAALLARAGASAVNSSGSNAGSSSSSSAARAAQDAAEAAAVQQLLQRGFDRLECAGPRPPPTGVQYADSSEDASGLSSSNSSSGSAVSSQGDMLDSSTSPDFSDQPGSRSAAPGTSGGAALRIEEAGSLAFEPVSTAVLRVLQHWQQQQQEQPVTLVVREAVEVKSHCPFGVRYARSGKKGRVDLAYKLSPRGCAGRVHPQWIPQLQLHTLATGCQSVLLVSRCAARGVRVYRIWRDDAYLERMMHLLQELQEAHVLRQIPPRPDSLSRLAAHKPFLNKTVALARGAECIAAVGEDFVAQVPETPVNKVLFWNTL